MTDQALDFYFAKIKQAGLRLMKQRKEIVKCLLKHPGWHTIDDIVSHLTKANGKKPNIASVYNILHSLIRHKMVNAFLNIDSFKPFFNLRHDDHEHVYCFSSQNAKFITLPLKQTLVDAVKRHLAANGFDAADFYVVANGLAANDDKDCK